MSGEAISKIELYVAWALLAGGGLLGLHWMRLALVAFFRRERSLGHTIALLVLPVILLTIPIAVIRTGAFRADPRNSSGLPRSAQRPPMSGNERWFALGVIAFGLVFFAIARVSPKD